MNIISNLIYVLKFGKEYGMMIMLKRTVEKGKSNVVLIFTVIPIKVMSTLEFNVNAKRICTEVN